MQCRYAWVWNWLDTKQLESLPIQLKRPTIIPNNRIHLT